MRAVFSKISNIIIVLLILAILLVGGLRITGFTLRGVETGSMEPELPVGSMIVAAPKEYKEIEVGDDITFVRNEALKVVTHRVVEKDDFNQTLTTQGIANNTKDRPVSYDNVLGVVQLCIPYFGYPAIWLDSLAGKVISITVIVALLAISLLLDKAKQAPKEEGIEKKEETKKEEA